MMLVFILFYKKSFLATIDTCKCKKKKTNNENQLMCLILTNEDNLVKKAIPVYNFWAQKCGKALFALNANNLNKSKYQELEFTIMNLNVTERREEMGIKTLKALNNAYANYHNEYKWFLLTDDDTYIFFNNLQDFISKRSFNDPFTYGFNFDHDILRYHSGGAGILLTHESLKRIIRSFDKGICKSSLFKHGDVALGYCGSRSNVTIGNSLDKKGRERFHFSSFEEHYYGINYPWALNLSKNGKIKNGIIFSLYVFIVYYSCFTYIREA
jgi:hypothetical protein